jgi:hypothetical protein
VIEMENEDLDKAARLWRECYLWSREGEGMPAGEKVGPYQPP